MEQILKIKTIHATAVSIEDKGILIVGKSGSGKSSLALSLIAKGAHLICDDRAKLKDSLAKNDIPTAVHYPLPLNKQPAFLDPSVNVPIGDELAEKVLSLPIHAYMDMPTRQRIVSIIVDEA